MLLNWRIRYIDSRDKQFKDRDLWLDTSTLEPAKRHVVELRNDLRKSGDQRAIVPSRSLFSDINSLGGDINEIINNDGNCTAFCIPDYFEDENGTELTKKQVAEILTGRPTAVMLPPGATQHDIVFYLSEYRPVQINKVTLSDDQLQVLGYFTRDFREMLNSAFNKDRPGVLTDTNGSFTIQTALSDEEIRSFVTIFRRLYMDSEPANLIKAITVLSDVISEYPLGKWIKGEADKYLQKLKETPGFIPMPNPYSWSFSRKRLIDVFIYTQYAHQPDEKRSRQYQECLDALGGETDLLFWLFLNQLWELTAHMRNAGQIVPEFYDLYCSYHQVKGEVLPSVIDTYPHIGTLEKKGEQQARLRHEKAQALAIDLWKENGEPEGGPDQYVTDALNRLNAAIADKPVQLGE